MLHCELQLYIYTYMHVILCITTVRTCIIHVTMCITTEHICTCTSLADIQSNSVLNNC